MKRNTDTTDCNPPAKDLRQPAPKIETEVVLDPSERVPIMFEITAEDLANSEKFTSPCNCIVATALRREGYDKVSVGPCSVRIGDKHYSADGIWSADLTLGDGLPYRPDVVGKQIILYPE